MRKMKLFALYLFFVPCISQGFIDPKPSGGNDSEYFFESSLTYLTLSLIGLAQLAKEDYAPAQQLLGFLNQDLKKAENFIREYNEMNLTPKLPAQKRYRNTNNWSRIKFQIISLFLSRKTSRDIQSGGYFAEYMMTLTKSLKRLEQAKQRVSFIEQWDFQNRFEKYIIDQIKTFDSIYPNPEALTQGCKKAFLNSFTSKAKKKDNG